MTVARSPRGEYAKTEARRREILEAGMEVFAEGGYRNGSIRDIAARVGISQAGLLHHFASKSELLAGVLALRDEKSQTQIGTMPQAGLDNIRAVVDLIDHNARVPGLVELQCILSAEATAADHPAHAYFVDRYRWLIDVSVQSFRALREEGLLREGVDPDTAAKAFIAVIDGLQLQWLLDRSSVDMAAIARDHVNALLRVTL